MNKNEYRKAMDHVAIREDLGESIVKALQQEDARRVWEESLPGREKAQKAGGGLPCGQARGGASAPPAKRPRFRKGAFAAAACCLALVLAVLPALSGQKPQVLDPGTDLVPSGSILQAKEYKEIYDKLAEYDNRYSYNTGNLGGNRVSFFDTAADFLLGGTKAEDSAAPESSAPTTGGAADNGAGSGGSSDHSGTNLQVEGVDEADIVKTDGKYLYILSGNTLVIAEAKGAETKVISKIQVGEFSEYKAGASEDSGKNLYPREFFVAGDRLILIRDVQTWKAETRTEYADGSLNDSVGASRLKSSWWYSKYETRTEAAYYDISNVLAPKLLKTEGQDGTYLNSRLTDGVLYLMTNYYVQEKGSEEDVATYIPRIYAEDQPSVLAPGNICCLPRIESKQYLVVTALKAADGSRLSSQAVLGGGDTVYMSHDNLYVAKSIYEDHTEVLPEKEGNYTVTRHTAGTCTDLMRFALNDGNLVLAASTRLEGGLLNQFSLDEFGDNLRLVTTVNTSRYETLTEGDGSRGYYEVYRPIEGGDQSHNNLLVLNQSLEEIGRIKELAKEERVYSVRFDGAIGYFVTFRQVDPLFTVDLSDPKAPAILSELKIPGFSQYLHPFGSDLLFGLGMDADAATGRTETMKLSMFNVKDPSNVTEQHCLKLSTYWSEALYNHKAILVAPNRNLIAFPADNGVYVFSYSAEKGFLEKGNIRVEMESWNNLHNARIFYIGDSLYVCGQESTFVFDLDSMSLQTRVDYGTAATGLKIQ